ncbi:MAG: N-acetylglucosamine kinase [Burkholderiales bacterium]|nr:ATPase [Betaproteobacteria bacterium]
MTVSRDASLGLGLDAGGTKTRWALSQPDGELVAEGFVAGLTALQLNTSDGRAHIKHVMTDLATQVAAYGGAKRVCAGVTGLDSRDELLCREIAVPLGIGSEDVTVHSDIEIAYRDLFRRGEGYVIYAGTGSVAAYIDPAGTLHRAGGRGVYLDDAGGGFWIVREALRHIWRLEDEQPGRWQQSPMAVAIFARIGGSDWSFSRQFFYTSDRGEIGQVATTVAAAVDTDPFARTIIEQAGVELARLGNAMIRRFGLRPLALAGGAARMHPLIESTLREQLPHGAELTVRVAEAHVAASRIAARLLFRSGGRPLKHSG